jgi:hypothetical protein
MSTLPLKKRPPGRFYQIRCKRCKATLPASIIGDRLWIGDVALDGAILPCPGCARVCSWWNRLPWSQALLAAAKTSGIVET